MSYLDPPRLHFSGQFQADPSTVNNTPDNFDNQTFNSQSPLSWNPNGTGAFRLLNITVTRTVYLDGSSCDDPAADPIVGALVNQADDRVTAKIVDLDSEQQMVSEIWGLQVRIVSQTNQEHFGGEFVVAPFTDLWIRASSAGGGDAPMAAAYQSTLTGVRFNPIAAAASRFLRELQSVTQHASLSIKFNLDGFQMDSTNPLFTVGRLVGTIGPYFAGEPLRFTAGRLLRPTPTNDTYPLNNIPPLTVPPPVYFIPAKLDSARATLTADLGNSLPTPTPGGPITDLGSIYLALLPVHNEAPVKLGDIAGYTDPSWYTQTAGVVSVPIASPQPLRTAEKTPLALLQATDPNGNGQGLPYIILAAENDSGAYLRADQQVFRLDPGESAQTRVLALRFGKPSPGEQIFLKQDAGLVNSKQNPFNPNSLPLGVPESALALPHSVATGPDGWATVSIHASDPGNPRGFIDGQVYGVAYSWLPAMWPGYNADPWDFLSILVWNAFPVPDKPTWADVQPFLKQYKNLYPIMGNIVDLSSYQSILRHQKSLEAVFALPVENPNSMPVTRDLSKAKRKTLLRWLNAPELLP